jgi:hypothetical protein
MGVTLNGGHTDKLLIKENTTLREINYTILTKQGPGERENNINDKFKKMFFLALGRTPFYKRHSIQ